MATPRRWIGIALLVALAQLWVTDRPASGERSQSATPAPSAVTAIPSAAAPPSTDAPTPAPPAEPDVRIAHGRGGAVAAEEPTAARAGIEILKKGGNATDAAVAVAFALAVTWPEAGNVGGGGFWISRDAAGHALVIDFRETAPRDARRDMFTRPNAR